MQPNAIEAAVTTLKNNEIIGLPTETVYGLAGNAYSEVAVQKIFALKKRPHFNPLIVHIKSAALLTSVAKNIPLVALQLADAFWPGPLSLVLEKQDHIPDIVTGGKNTVGVRVPNHPLALELMEQLDFPLAAPSANPFGSISPTTAKHVADYFKNELDIILDGGSCDKGIESTIVGFENGQAVLYRQGSTKVEDIEKITGPLQVRIHANNESVMAPGMLSKHYAPSTTTILTDDIASEIEKHAGKRIGILQLSPTTLPSFIIALETLSQNENLEEAAKNLYAAMHRLDHQHLDLIVVQKMPAVGMGLAINDKLERAATK
jgi:L-threonylcarbamoyladenylate synthase